MKKPNRFYHELVRKPDWDSFFTTVALTAAVFALLCMLLFLAHVGTSLPPQ